MSGDAGDPTDGVLGLDHLALPMQNTAAMVDFYRSLGLLVEEHAAVVRVFMGDQMINFHLPEFWLGDFPLRAPAARPPCGDLCLVWQGAEQSLAGPSGRASTSATRTAISSNS
jgi:catechol 2,3-dioxygenase-like lactoylglutathione lyase family enzyme